MTKIKITFPNGFECYATMREKEEPEFCAQLLNALKPGKNPICTYHTISTGCLFDAFPRPPKHPQLGGNQVDIKGNSSKLICDLEPGEISSSCWSWAFCYGFCSEIVAIGGPVIAKCDPEYLDGFITACRDIWYHDYLYHKLGIINIEKVED